MNRNDLFRSFSEIDDQALIRTESYKKRKNTQWILRLMAASLTMVLLVFGASYLLSSDPPNQTPSSWFVITAYAEEGEWTELGLNDGCFNSGPTDQSMFPADVPLFYFVMNPTDWDGYENEYRNFTISVCCNGQPIGSSDDRIQLFHLYATPDSDLPFDHAYEVVGWVEETTDITITVVDQGTGDLVEEIVVTVEPQQDTDAYQLKVTGLKTNLSIGFTT